MLIEIVVEVIVTLVINLLTLNLLILALVQTLTLEITNTLIKMIKIPTNITTTLLEMILLAALGMNKITKTRILIINPTTLLLALLPSTILTLVIVLIVNHSNFFRSYKTPYRPPSQPRCNRSRSHSNSKSQFQPAVNQINLPLQLTLLLK